MYAIVWDGLFRVNFGGLSRTLIELGHFVAVLLFERYHVLVVKTFMHTLRCIKSFNGFGIFFASERGSVGDVFLARRTLRRALPVRAGID